MSGIITEHNLFKPRPSRTETKADLTSHVARTITGAAAVEREVKTARLRQARLEAEAKAAALPTPDKPRRSSAAGSRRGRSSM